MKNETPPTTKGGLYLYLPIMSILDLTTKIVKGSTSNPVCPDSGSYMLDVTTEIEGLPQDYEVWESVETGSLFIRTSSFVKIVPDYNEEELKDVRVIAKSILV